MLSNTVGGPAPSVSDDLYSAAAAFAAATSSAILLLATRRLQTGTGMSGEIAATVAGTKAATDPRMRDDDASIRGTNFLLWAVMVDGKQLLYCGYRESITIRERTLASLSWRCDDQLKTHTIHQHHGKESGGPKIAVPRHLLHISRSPSPRTNEPRHINHQPSQQLVNNHLTSILPAHYISLSLGAP